MTSYVLLLLLPRGVAADAADASVKLMCVCRGMRSVGCRMRSVSVEMRMSAVERGRFQQRWQTKTDVALVNLRLWSVLAL